VSIIATTTSANTTALTPAAYIRWCKLRDQLTIARRTANISQDDVAGAAGVSSRTTIGRIERGEAMPGIETFIAWAQALDLEPVLVPPSIGKFLDLDLDEISSIVRAAAHAVEDETMLSTDLRRRVHLALARLKTRPPQREVS
jgi:transcriptional regulator with XRE-family HTH domain